MHNYKLTIQYDGTDYAGWQIQNDLKTIQGEITTVINTILQSKINLIGSGRTDAGVHALGQVANFRYEKELDQRRFIHSLNSMLNSDISISHIEKTDSEFHSRFDAKRRSYLYLFTHSKNPFYNKYSCQYSPVNNYSIKKLNELSSVLKGEHDFTSFCRTKTEIENKKCEVFEIHWRRSTEQTLCYIEANRFLHGMVRTIVGTLLNAVKSNFGADYLMEILENKDRKKAAEAVPAKGLFLYKVRY